MQTKYLSKKRVVYFIVLLYFGSCVLTYGTITQSKKSISSANDPEYHGVWMQAGKISDTFVNSAHDGNPTLPYLRSPNTLRNPVTLPQNPLLNNKVAQSIGNKTLYVGGSGPNNYSDIPTAINAAQNGDTVFVYNDSSPYYQDFTLTITRSIKLIGENKETTVIDQSRESPIFTSPIIDIINTEGVTVSGFTLRNSGDFFADYGIEIESNHNTISGNIIMNNYMGIYINGYGSYNMISHNVIKSNINGGVFLYSSKNNIISNNTFSNNLGGLILDTDSNNNIVSDNTFENDGIWVADAHNNTFINNVINGKWLEYLEDKSDVVINNSYAGQVILVGCQNITIIDNVFSNTCTSIQLSNSANCLIKNNMIQSDTRPCVLLVKSNGNTLTTNTLSDSYIGIYLSQSSNNIITRNAITSCSADGVYLYSSSFNQVEENTLSDNKGLNLQYSDENTLSQNTLYHDGVGLYGYYEDITSNILSNNTVNGKPLLCLVGEADMIVGEAAGQIILMNCHNITVQNQDLSNTIIGLLLVNTDHSQIVNNTMTNDGGCAALFFLSTYNTFSLNSVVNNTRGVLLYFSDHSSISGNTVRSNPFDGIELWNSNNNTISTNTLEKNGGRKFVRNENLLGIFLYTSSYNTISHNNFLHNARDAFFNNCTRNNWNGNYWSRPRVLPKLILGETQKVIPLPIINLLNMRFNVDWHPAQKPYDI